MSDLHKAMNRSFPESSNWYHAITLNERIASLYADQRETPKDKINTHLAEKRMQRWQSQYQYTSNFPFAQRLRASGIAEDEFLYLISESAETLRNRIPEPPEWLMAFAQAFSAPASSHKNSSPLPGLMDGQRTSGFLNIVEPLVQQGRDQLHAGIEEIIHTYPNLPVDRSTIGDLLLANLPSRLLWMMNRTMALELNVARLQGLLYGSTSEERFQSFIQLLSQRNTALTLLQEYPVLARQLVLCIRQWVDFSLEFLQRLGKDWEKIQTTFSLENNPGVLVQLERSVNETHREGRGVVTARFNSGFQVVYKPRTMQLDMHFQELLIWLNDRGHHSQFRILKILDLGNYGWMEFVVAEGCTFPEEIQRFYERQGGYLALLFALEAIDFHFENLIAAGEHPVLVDLETLFHPRVGVVELKQANALAVNTLHHSVLRVGLLPQRKGANAESEGIDLSGLGAAAGQLTPFDVPQWEGVGTDEMRFVRKRAAVRRQKNRPTLNGVDVDLLSYAEAIVDGFTSVYRLLLKHRDELLSEKGHLTRFVEDEVRVILRATHTYSVLLYESFHPDVLRNALDRDLLFDRLWVQLEHQPHLAQTVPAEIEDLHKGDIPMFTTRANSRDLWSSSGERIAVFFDEPGLTLVERRVRQLCEDDLEKHLWFIRASLATLSKDISRVRRPTVRSVPNQAIADRERLLAAARAVGDRLEVLALRGEDDATWIGLTLATNEQWLLAPLGIHLYDGLSGVVLFLAYLGEITLEERYTVLAQAALISMQRQIEYGKPFVKSVGGFDGWGGVIYTLTHLYTLWNRPELLAEAEEIVEFIPELIEQDKNLDIIGGVAGCIGSLINLYRVAPSNYTLATAIQCGDRLIAHAQPMEHGIGWVNHAIAKRPLAGFSHGAAGMAWALLELAELTGQERFRSAALAAVAYERSLFSFKDGNWPDLRESESQDQGVDDNRERFMTAWCHGAPGIGLARLSMLRYIDDAEIHLEIDAALKTTLNQGFGSNHSLCHGDLGSLEFLLQTSEALNDQQLNAQVYSITSVILNSVNNDGWLCGIPLGVESPGLMTGLAGIGYGLLRLAEPSHVPSVLTLAPPLTPI